MVGMPAALDDERGLDQVHRVTAAYSQPQVVILAGRQAHIEAPDPLEQLPAHHYRRRTHQAELKRRLKNHSIPLAVPLAGVHPAAVFDPNLLCLTDESLWVQAKKFDLSVKLTRQPEVVGVQEGDQPSRATSRPALRAALTPLVILTQHPDGMAIFC